MKVNLVSGVYFLLIFLGILCSCQNRSSPKNNLSDINLLRGEISLCGGQQFGEVDFALNCKTEARGTFDLALSLLHSFEYEEAEKAFVKVIDMDPNCAMGYWGVAMSNFHSLWLQNGNDYLKKGSKILAAASTLNLSERDKDYINAIAVFYQDWETIDNSERILRYEGKMKQLYEKYKDEKEAAIFYALALTAAADPTDKSYKNQRESGKILESIYPNQPNHPGIAHYIIHNYDYPELASLALPTARKYAQIAPASAHAQHMPSHIFTRLGLWEESIQSNINSTNSALCYASRIDPDSHWDEELHGMDYLVYAYLQLGKNKEADAQYEYLKTFKKVFPINFKIAYAVAAIPARIALENRNWEMAASLELPEIKIQWKDFPWQKSIFHFAKALGSIRLGDLDDAESELIKMQFLHGQLVEIGDHYKANQVNVQINIIKAWILLSQGNQNEAVALIKAATQMEYGTAKHPVTPGEVLPAGEILGDLLMAINHPAEALKAYEYDLTQHPNRFNGIYGAATAAKASGNGKKAKEYFEMLVLQTNKSNSDRKEIATARKELNRLN